MKHLFRTAAFLLGYLFAPSIVLAQDLVPDDAEALRRLRLYRTDLIATLPDPERRIAQRVVLRAPVAGSLAQVGAALAPDGTPFISINQGTHYAMQQLGEAAALGVYVLKSDSFLMGYIRYLAYWDQFGGQPLTAVQFAQHYGVADAQARLDALSDTQRASGQDVEALVMLFITAHELAHHIYGDVIPGFVSAAEQRQREARADAWAAYRVMAMGYSPEVAVMTMLILNETESPKRRLAPSRRHPEAMRRAQDLMRNVLDNISANPQMIRNALERSPGGPSFDAYAQGMHKMDQQLHAQAEEQRQLDTDAAALIRSATAGNIRSQLRLAAISLSGEMAAIPRNQHNARFWAERAAMNATPYEFFDSAFAAYMAGKLVSNDGDDNTKACNYMSIAVRMSLTLGAIQFEQFKKDGICAE